MHRGWLRLAALIGFVAVGGGAFGAHALADRLADKQLEWWHTGARYALVHAPVLFGVALAHGRARAAPLRVAGFGFALGVAIFTGSLWTMALGGPRWLGAITPIGGLCLLVGWAALAVSAGDGAQGSGSAP